MELDELKKSWNALDAQLQKEPIADEKQIKELIAIIKQIPGTVWDDSLSCNASHLELVR